MFLLNRLAISAAPKAVIKFTSHYVPIKSTFLFIVLFLPIYLHPIMFLLNRHVNYNILVQLLYLHPIMFLLNLVALHILHLYTAFTSHYVPIKSMMNNCEDGYSHHLHPIMFLLNLSVFVFVSFIVSFTSHYVPIKSLAAKSLSVFLL